MGRVVNVLFRIVGCILAIQGINWVLKMAGISLLVGMNGYTVVLAAILGFPGILGLYAFLYFF